MSKTNKVQYRSFQIAIANSGDTVRKEFQVDDDVVAVTGIAVSSDRESQLWYRGSQEVRIGGDEIFPKDHESKCIQFGPDSAVRYFDIGSAPISNRKIEVYFTDKDTAAVVFSAYTVTVRVRLQLKDQ